jgi:hypothetical protein
LKTNVTFHKKTAEKPQRRAPCGRLPITCFIILPHGSHNKQLLSNAYEVSCRIRAVRVALPGCLHSKHQDSPRAAAGDGSHTVCAVAFVGSPAFLRETRKFSDFVLETLFDS